MRKILSEIENHKENIGHDISAPVHIEKVIYKTLYEKNRQRKEHERGINTKRREVRM